MITEYDKPITVDHKCTKTGCPSYAVYIRIVKQWFRVGRFHFTCKTFTYDPSAGYISYVQSLEDMSRRLRSHSHAESV